MATATFAATTLCHGSVDAWNTANAARQGIYAASDSSMKTARTGIMYYSGMGDTLQGKYITNISIAYTIGGSGGSWAKTIRFVESNYQTAPTKSGSPYPGAYITGRDAIGTYDLASGSSHSSTITLNSSTNEELFYGFANYLESGANIICIHSTDTGNKSGYSYSTNYLEITKFTITVTYEDRYDITIDPNGGVLDPHTYVYIPDRPSIDIGDTDTQTVVRCPAGSSIDMEYNPTKEGHDLVSWNLDGPGSISEGQVGTRLITGAGAATLTAMWEPKSVPFSYDSGGFLCPDVEYGTFGSEFTPYDIQYLDPIVDVDPEGAIFLDPNGGTVTNTVVEFEDTRYTYPVAWHYSVDDRVIRSNETIFVGVDALNAESRILSLETALYIEREVVSLPKPVKPGYKFLGWKATYPYAIPSRFIMSESDKTLHPGMIEILGRTWIDDGVFDPDYDDGLANQTYWFDYKIGQYNVVPVLYLEEEEAASETGDGYYYDTDVTLNGESVHRWRKVAVRGSHPNWSDASECASYIYTPIFLERQDMLFQDSILPWWSDAEFVAQWELQGLVHIDNGTQWCSYTVWIDNGTEWKQYMMYIDNGTEWKLLGG